MTKQELLEEIKEVLQRDEELSLDMNLTDIEEWDSLATISIISLYDELFSKIINGDTLKSCNSVNDLIELVIDNLDD
ncbi:acyl carrier protein [Halarcobacter sp.]|uniref:acyl carrier protein n=1 Tax=Halarcobacter sp. TaxID=2321133 RepID=UPI003AFFCC56